MFWILSQGRPKVSRNPLSEGIRVGKAEAVSWHVDRLILQWRFNSAVESEALLYPQSSVHPAGYRFR